MSFNFNEFKINENDCFKQHLINKIENYDYEIFKNYDKKIYKIIKKRNRIIKTQYGDICFNRRIYKNKITNKIISFTDQWLELKPYERISKFLKDIIINQIGKGKRYCDIKDLIINSNISIVSISNIIKNAQLKIIKPLEKIKVKDNEYIYINIDDSFQSVLNEKYKKEMYKIRVISFNLGIDKIKSNYKNVLKHKKINFIFNKTSLTQKDSDNLRENLADFVWKKLNEYYDFYNAKLVVAGDGANWIRNLSKTLGAYYVFDKYHGLKYLWTLFKPNNAGKIFNLNKEKFNKYKIAKELFYNGKYDELLIYLKENNVNKEIYRVFKTNKDGIINQNKPWNIGCSAESDVFHLVKSLKGNGAKIYNYKVFENMLIARANQINSKL